MYFVCEIFVVFSWIWQVFNNAIVLLANVLKLNSKFVKIQEKIRKKRKLNKIALSEIIDWQAKTTIRTNQSPRVLRHKYTICLFGSITLILC